MDLDRSFQEAAEQVKKLSETPEDNDLLELYGLYKQSILGDNDTARPGMFNFKDKAKWDAWSSNRGLEKETAKQQYVDVVNRLISIYGLQK